MSSDGNVIALSRVPHRHGQRRSAAVASARFLIDPEGTLPVGEHRLAQLREIAGLDDPSLFTFLCRNMGYVEVQVESTAATITLAYNPSAIGGPAAQRLIRWIGDNGGHSYSLHVHRKSGIEVLAFASGADCLAYVANSVDQRRTGERRFFSRSLDIASPAGVRYRQLLFLAANNRGGELGSFLREVLIRRFQSRYVVVRPDSGGPAGTMLRLIEAGDGYTGLGQDWRRTSLGRPINEVHDAAYGAFVLAAFTAVVRSGAPSLNDIDAVVRTPTGSMLLSYQRLIVPLAGGRLLGVSARNHDPIRLPG